MIYVLIVLKQELPFSELTQPVWAYVIYEWSLRHQMETSPEQTPDYLMIDGNGLVQDLNFRSDVQV